MDLLQKMNGNVKDDISENNSLLSLMTLFRYLMETNVSKNWARDVPTLALWQRDFMDNFLEFTNANNSVKLTFKETRKILFDNNEILSFHQT